MLGTSRLDAAGLALAAFFLVLTALYVPFLLDPAVAPRWAWLSVGVPVLMMTLSPKGGGWTFGHAAGLAFLALAVLSLSWTLAPFREGLDALWQLLLMAGLFAIGARRGSLRPVWIGAGAGMAINSAVVIWQWAGWHGWVPRPSVVNTGIDGLFFNSNWSAEAGALVLIGCFAARLWPLAAAAAPTVLLSGARAAMLAVAATGLAWLWRRSWTAAILLVLIGAVALPQVPHLGAGAQVRLDLWQDTAEALTWRGHGLGSFYLAYPAHGERLDTTRVRPEHAHNDFLEVAYELGPVGLAVFLALLGYALAGPAETRPVLAGFAVIACFSFPLHQPVTAALAAVSCGHLCGDRASLRYLLARGRMALQRARRPDDPARAGVVARETGGRVVSARWPLPRRTGVFL